MVVRTVLLFVVVLESTDYVCFQTTYRPTIGVRFTSFYRVPRRTKVEYYEGECVRF